jgi:hypothetical protein
VYCTNCTVKWSRRGSEGGRKGELELQEFPEYIQSHFYDSVVLVACIVGKDSSLNQTLIISSINGDFLDLGLVSFSHDQKARTYTSHVKETNSRPAYFRQAKASLESSTHTVLTASG